LIKWLTSRPEAPGKVVIFLVPMVALVEQQAEYLSQRMPLRIAGVHGEQAKDLSDRKGWAQRFAETDVFVMTGKFHKFDVSKILTSMISSGFPQHPNSLNLEYRQSLSYGVRRVSSCTKKPSV
jgi:hypothetical protein